jgi:hypothetical protein
LFDFFLIDGGNDKTNWDSWEEDDDVESNRSSSNSFNKNINNNYNNNILKETIAKPKEKLIIPNSNIKNKKVSNKEIINNNNDNINNVHVIHSKLSSSSNSLNKTSITTKINSAANSPKIIINIPKKTTTISNRDDDIFAVSFLILLSLCFLFFSLFNFIIIFNF